MTSHQIRIGSWIRTVFGEAVATNQVERALRVAEEATEIAQACGVDPATLHRLIDYVFSRPRGEPEREIAGCMVTLYAIASTLGVDAETALEAEIARIHQPEIIERCRRRQREKDEAAITGANHMDALNGPECACGLPSKHESGWCGTGCVASNVTPLVDVAASGATRLPPQMVLELGSRVWFLRGKDHWEAWAEDELERVLAPAGFPKPSAIVHVTYAYADGKYGSGHFEALDDPAELFDRIAQHAKMFKAQWVWCEP